MKYICEYEGTLGGGDTLLEAFKDLESNADDYIDPANCEYYKAVWIQVTVKQDITITEAV